jgi:ubiquinone/menaquinone biosynthesis C-methylase UbiE
MFPSMRGGENLGTYAKGIYAKYVLPRVLDLAMRKKDLAQLRALWVSQARGEVLEVGMGSGLNLPFYSEDVQSISGVEPSLEMQKIARKRLKAERPVVFLTQSAEDKLPFAESSVDTVLSTWTLCTIPDAPRALREMRRVLRPEGRFIFIEHGCSPDAGVVAWQNRLNPVWNRIGGGCNLNRKIAELIEGAGFRITELKTEYLPGPRPMTYTYQGFAEKA